MPNPAAFPRAGDAVEVIDRHHKLFGFAGTIAYFVGDNVYVRFANLRWSKTRMFFPDQLRAACTRGEHERNPAAVAAPSLPQPARVAGAHAAVDVNARRDG